MRVPKMKFFLNLMLKILLDKYGVQFINLLKFFVTVVEQEVDKKFFIRSKMNRLDGHDGYVYLVPRYALDDPPLSTLHIQTKEVNIRIS